MLTIYCTVAVQEQRSLMLCFSCFIVLNWGLFYFMACASRSCTTNGNPFVCLWEKRLRCCGDSMSPYSWVPFVFSWASLQKVSWENFSLDVVSWRDHHLVYTGLFESRMLIWSSGLTFTALCLCSLCSACWTGLSCILVQHAGLECKTTLLKSESGWIWTMLW